MTAAVSVVDLARSLLRPHRDGLGVILVLSAFFDASLTEPTGITSLGGFVGSEDEWKRVEAEWIANLAMWKIDDFHLCDLPQLVGHTDAPLCALNFSTIIKDSKLHAIGAALNDIDWDSERSRYPTLPGKYLACLAMLIQVLHEHVRLKFPDQPVLVVLDRDFKNEAEPRAVFNANAPASWSLAFSDRRAAKALQCADLAAGEWRRGWLEATLNGEEFREFKRIVYNLSAERMRGSFWSAKTAEREADELVATMRRMGMAPDRTPASKT